MTSDDAAVASANVDATTRSSTINVPIPVFCRKANAATVNGLAASVVAMDGSPSLTGFSQNVAAEFVFASRSTTVNGVFKARSVVLVIVAAPLFAVERPSRNCPLVAPEVSANTRARNPVSEPSLKDANHAPPAVGSEVKRAVKRA